MEPNKTTAAIYLRRSHLDSRDADGSDNRSLSSQEHDCQVLADRMGLPVSHIYAERVGTSASHLTTNRRPEMERALAEMGTTYNTLIVWAFDRATRKGIAEAGAILDRVEEVGGRLVSVSDGVDTEDPTARLIIAIRAEMARDEMTKMSDRVKRGKAEQVRRGEYLGGPVPFGLIAHRVPNQPTVLIPDPEAIPVMKEAAEMIVAGAYLNEVARHLNDQGHRTSTGYPWRGQTISQMFNTPYVLGYRQHKGVIYTDDEGQPVQVHDPLLDEALVQRVRRAMSSRSTSTSTKKVSGKRARSMLGGLIRCGVCGQAMARKKCQREGATAYVYYLCKGCVGPSHSVNLQAADDYVARMALSRLSSLSLDSPIVEEVGRRWLARFSPEQATLRTEAEDECESLEGRLRDLRRNFYEFGKIPQVDFEQMERNLERRINDLRTTMDSMPESAPDLSALFDLAQSSDNLDGDIVGEGSAWANLPDYERRTIIRCMVEHVVVEHRPRPGDDIDGRMTIEFATPSNVVELSSRTGLTQRGAAPRRRVRTATA